MSNFDGTTKEYESISIDRFDGKNLHSTLYLLSHFHSDHTVGLGSDLFKERLKSNKEIKLYCTDVTKNLLFIEDAYQLLSDSIISLHVNVPYELDIPMQTSGEQIDRSKSREQITLTLLPAGHCPGSAMFMVEGVGGRILYTGDFRISMKNLKLLKPLFYENGNPKEFKSLYVDTTFFHPNNTFIPSRAYSLMSAIEVVGHWIGQCRSKVVRLKFKASLGCEHLLTAISKHFNMKIHVSSYKLKQCINIGKIGDVFTTDPSSTQIHACDLIKPSIAVGQNGNYSRQGKKSQKKVCHCKSITEASLDDLRTVTFSAMCFTQVVTPNRYCVPIGRNDFKICYSLHPSYTEVCRFIDCLKPKQALANVLKLGSNTPKDYDVQKELNDVVGKSEAGRNLFDVNDVASNVVNNNVEENQIEKKLKRQFSESSMDNFIFDETQSYLRSVTKRSRNDSYDLSMDIMEIEKPNNETKTASQKDEDTEGNNETPDIETDGISKKDGNTRKNVPSGSVMERRKNNKRKFSLLFGSEDELAACSDSDDAVERSSKRVCIDADALREHIRGQNNVDSSCPYMFESMSYMSSDDDKDGHDSSCNDDDDYDTGIERNDLNKSISGVTKDSDFIVATGDDDSAREVNAPFKICHVPPSTSLDGFNPINCHSSTSQKPVVRNIEIVSLDNTKENVIDLGGDEEEEEDDDDVKKESHTSRSDIFLDSDVTIDLNSSFECRCTGQVNKDALTPQHLKTSLSPAGCITPTPSTFNIDSKSPPLRILPPSSSGEQQQQQQPSSSGLSSQLKSSQPSSSPALHSPSLTRDKKPGPVPGKRGNENDDPVVCIDLTEDVEDDNEDCLEDDDEGEDEEEDKCLVELDRKAFYRYDNRQSCDDESDDVGYDGGDECESSAHDIRNNNNDCSTAENRTKDYAGTTNEVIVGNDEDINGSASSYDSDAEYFKELERKCHARFEKLYKRKQKKIKIKTRRQNLRNGSEDDVIVIEDDDTSEDEDSYDYDSDGSSSDYEYSARSRNQRCQKSINETEQFVVPSMSSSSESSSTLSSEDDAVVVLLNVANNSNVTGTASAGPASPHINSPNRPDGEAKADVV